MEYIILYISKHIILQSSMLRESKEKEIINNKDSWQIFMFNIAAFSTKQIIAHIN